MLFPLRKYSRKTPMQLALREAEIGYLDIVAECGISRSEVSKTLRHGGKKKAVIMAAANRILERRKAHQQIEIPILTAEDLK